MSSTEIRRCRPDERAAIHAIINAAAEAYRGKIPSDCFHEPYMPREELDREIAAGVEFWGCEIDSALVGVMGIQPVKDVTLVRHAYTRPDVQGKGIGGRLLSHSPSPRCGSTESPCFGTGARSDAGARARGLRAYTLRASRSKLKESPQ